MANRFVKEISTAGFWSAQHGKVPLFLTKVNRFFTRLTTSIGEKTLSFIIIFLTVLFTHGLLLINDGIYWDDFVWYDLRSNTYHWNRIFEAGSEMGTFFYERYFSYLFTIIFPTPVLANRFYVFTCILVSGFLIYLLCAKSGFFNSTESLLVGLIFVTYPAFKTQVSLSTTFYQIYFALFILAVYIQVNIALPRKVNVLYVLARLFTLIFFFLSYSLNSLLVVFYVFVLYLFLKTWDKKVRQFHRHLLWFVLRYFDLLILPLLYWWIKKTFYSTHGFYATYNQFKLTIPIILNAFDNFVANGIVSQFGIAFDFLGKRLFLWESLPAFFYILIPILLTAWVFWKFPTGMFQKETGSHLLFPILFGLVLLLAAMLPYIVTGNFPGVYGWRTRNALLIGFPIAILIVSLLRLIFRTPASHLSRLGAGFAMFFVLAFSLVLIQSYLQWQIRWIKDQSVMYQLSRIENIQQVSVFQIKNLFTTLDQEKYQFYEWTGLFYDKFGTQKMVGLDLADHLYPDRFLTDYGKRFFIERYNLGDFDPHGCQVLLTIERGPLFQVKGSLPIVYEYFYYKFRAQDEILNRYFLSYATIHLESVSSPVATNCKLNVNEFADGN